MSAELIHQMYIAYYQRPADPAGLIYWQDQLNANGGGEAGWNASGADTVTPTANAAEEIKCRFGWYFTFTRKNRSD